ncbi:uncharacterized protein LOC119996902 [Tripterygium wilfordii]|uniref:uncharacterized protein LOC119996902 n=1 Tax=Tripterygium wilfordii TaxID=458696 RepID=UPI0018F8183F|nr:uncharacterized protein LOC119996902 [Tripterygium wilfordii]
MGQGVPKMDKKILFVPQLWDSVQVNKMVKTRANRHRLTQIEDYTNSDNEVGSEDIEEEFLPEDSSSEDDEEVIVAREKIKVYRRGWRGVALLNDSDNEKDAGDNQGETLGRNDEDSGDNEGVVGGENADVEGDESDREHSSYIDSSDPGSYIDSTDEEPEVRDDAVRRKSRFPSFKKQKGIPIFELSMLFDSNDEFKDAINSYAILTRHDIRFTKNEPNRCRAKCKGSFDCPWIIFASYNRDIGSFQVKTYVNEHSCEQKRGLKRLTSKFLYNKFYGFITAHPDIKLRYLKAFIKQSLSLDVKMQQCKRLKKSVLADMEGDCIKEYAKLRDYAEELIVSNPGTIVDILTDRQNEGDLGLFKAFYCCFKSCKQGILNRCRPVLGVDGCFLKGLVKGELLTAIGRDGNNQMFPVAWAVVLVENTDTWTWFLNLLRHDLGTVEGEGWTIISDRQKGLVSAVADTWSKAEHRFYCRHLYANWCKTHPGRHLKKLFWTLAKSTNKVEFEERYKDIEKVNPVVAKDLKLVDPKYWCKAFFSPLPRCDNCDNNLCEAFNSTILEARTKSIISMLEDIGRGVMRRIRDQRVGVSSWKHDYGPLIHKKLQENVKESHIWVAEWNGGGSYEDKCGRRQFVVILRDGVCT